MPRSRTGRREWRVWLARVRANAPGIPVNAVGAVTAQSIAVNSGAPNVAFVTRLHDVRGEDLIWVFAPWRCCR